MIPMKCLMSLSASKSYFEHGGLLDQVRMIDLPSNIDSRGMLTAIESQKDIPFEIKRIFYMHDVREDRGGHAHIDTDQIIIPVSGSFSLSLFDGSFHQSYKLDDAKKGLYVPHMIFIELSCFSKGSVCLVLASDHYDMARSLRNREDYVQYLEEHSD